MKMGRSAQIWLNVMTLTYAKEIPSTTIATMQAIISGPVGLKSEPSFSAASTSRLEEITSSSHSFILSGISPSVFFAADPPSLPSGLLIAERIAANTAIIAADIPTAIAALTGLGTQTCCRRSEPDD